MLPLHDSMSCSEHMKTMRIAQEIDKTSAAFMLIEKTPAAFMFN